MKHNSSGIQLWVARYDGPGSLFDHANAIALDALGNIYVAGRYYEVWPDSGYATIKYDSSGNELWVVRYSGPGCSDDEARSIARDTTGNVYATGILDLWGISDYATVAYDSSGTEIWIATYNGPGNRRDEVADIAVDSYGDVYVTGLSVGVLNNPDFTTIKYS